MQGALINDIRGTSLDWTMAHSMANITSSVRRRKRPQCTYACPMREVTLDAGQRPLPFVGSWLCTSEPSITSRPVLGTLGPRKH